MSKCLKLTNEREHLKVKLLIVKVNKFGFNSPQLVESQPASVVAKRITPNPWCNGRAKVGSWKVSI